ncbi:Lrp/AsnC family transcriptional regulator [Streptomyces apocyni]|uniref:Lrp/AsnC family transcriptional regulator n=1 Tax=Streptomyces apocyni TaxID=2654677 RepID=UPI0012E9A0E2|nr:Lrp/AsnC family transcriptional regulator [Streptomyces apocyni]
MLNPLDEAIVRALAEDGRRSYAEIGAEIGRSAPAVKRRVDRLRERGIIDGFTVRMNPELLGWKTEGLIELFCRRSTTPEVIHCALTRYPEVATASTVTGDVDAIVQVFAADTRHFEQILERIASEPFVERTRSALVLSPLLRRSDPTFLT